MRSARCEAIGQLSFRKSDVVAGEKKRTTVTALSTVADVACGRRRRLAVGDRISSNGRVDIHLCSRHKIARLWFKTAQEKRAPACCLHTFDWQIFPDVAVNETLATLLVPVMGQSHWATPGAHENVMFAMTNVAWTLHCPL
jgi:hypothetical protein